MKNINNQNIEMDNLLDKELNNEMNTPTYYQIF